MNKPFLLAVIILGTFWVTTLSLAQVNEKNLLPPRTGLVHTKADQAKILKEWPRIIKVHLNQLGLERVNAERHKKGLFELAEKDTAPKGHDVEYVLPNVSVPLAGSSGLFANASTGSSTVPAAVDNSKTIWFPPIGNQGQEGACVSFATTYYQLSYLQAQSQNYAITTNGVTDNTRIFSPKWTYNMVNGGSDYGSSFTDSYGLLQNNGASSLAQLPYTSGDYRSWPLDTKTWQSALSQRTNQVVYLSNFDGTASGVQQLKQLLTNGYIVTFGTYIYHYDASNNLVWDWHFTNLKTNSGAPENSFFAGQQAAAWVDNQGGGHAMTVVGYDDNIWVDINGNGQIDPGEMGAFKIANSWGTGWGNGGFWWLSYDALNPTSQVSGGPASSYRVPAFSYGSGGNQVYYTSVKQNSDGTIPYKPKLIGAFTVNQAQRSLLAMSLGISGSTGSIPSKIWSSGTLWYSGGPYAFNGTTTDVDGNFVLDFTDILPTTAVNDTYYLGMTGGSSSNPSVLKSYQLMDLTSNTNVSSSQTPLQSTGPLVYAKINYAYSPTPVTMYALTVNAPNGKVSLNPNQTSFPAGSTVTLTATGNSGYQFSSWSGSLSSVIDPLTITVNSNMTLTANFIAVPMYTLTVSAATGGSVSLNPNQTSFNAGSTVTLTATANSGYHFYSWSGNATGSANPLTVTVNSNMAITPVFYQVPVVNAGPSQTITQTKSTAVITISATASDNGLPFASTWKEASGPAPVVFGNSSSLTTSVTFSKPGSYVLTLTVYDGTAQASSSTTINVLDGTPPFVSITSPTNGSRVSGSVNITASASDDVSVKSVKFYIDGVLEATDASSPYSYKWSTNRVRLGSHTIYAVAFDTAGNSAASVTVTVKK